VGKKRELRIDWYRPHLTTNKLGNVGIWKLQSKQHKNRTKLWKSMDGTSKMAKESTKKSQIRSWVPGAWGSAVSQLGSVDHLDLWVINLTAWMGWTCPIFEVCRSHKIQPEPGTCNLARESWELDVRFWIQPEPGTSYQCVTRSTSLPVIQASFAPKYCLFKYMVIKYTT
jgi:hypothetical protein